MIDLSFLDSSEPWNKEMTRLVMYFMQNTTDRIFRRMNELGIYSPSIRNAIRGVVYNNAAGQMPLVRFYYTNIARFIELGVGRYREVDFDLGGEGIKVRNITHTDQITSGPAQPLEQTFGGTTNKGIAVERYATRKKDGRRVDRSEKHKAKPFFMNSIKLEVKKIAERLACELAYTETLYISRGLTATLEQENADAQWRRNLGLIQQAYADLHVVRVPELED